MYKTLYNIIYKPHSLLLDLENCPFPPSIYEFVLIPFQNKPSLVALHYQATRTPFIFTLTDTLKVGDLSGFKQSWQRSDSMTKWVYR